MPRMTARVPDRRASSFVLLLVLLLEPCAAEEPALETAIPRPPRPTRAVSDATAGPKSYVSVIGAVVYPATFESSQPPILGDLITRAGGMTEGASGAVRVIRNNGPQPQLDYYQGLPAVKVPDGSVVVAEPRTDAVRTAIGRDGEFVDVACLNLLERPLVQWLPPREANLQDLLLRLGQSGTMTPGVQILAPGRAETETPDRLAPGMVLVFDRRTVDAAALRSLAAQTPWRDVAPLQDAGPALDQRPGSRELQIQSDDDASATTVSHAPPSATRVPVTVDPAATSSSTKSAGRWPADSQVPVAGHVAPLPPRESVPSAPLEPGGTTVHVPRLARPPTRRPQVAEAGRPLWTIAAALAVSVTLGWVTFRILRAKLPNIRMSSGTKSVEPACDAIHQPRRHPLDELINNELPLVEEDAAFPPAMTLHGRTVGFRYLLHGSTSGPQGPHFTPEQSRPQRAQSGNVSAPQLQPALDSGAAAPAGSRDTIREVDDLPSAATLPPVPRPVAPARTAHASSPMERALLARRRGGPNE